MNVRKYVVGYMKKVWLAQYIHVTNEPFLHIIQLCYSYTLCNIVYLYIKLYIDLHILIYYSTYTYIT